MTPNAAKSRNGCLTCKKRRVKCDETKPTCLRCRGVHVACAGYPGKEYKWRVVKDVPIASDGAESWSTHKSPSTSRMRTYVASAESAAPAEALPTPSPDINSALTSAAHGLAVDFSNPLQAQTGGALEGEVELGTADQAHAVDLEGMSADQQPPRPSSYNPQRHRTGQKSQPRGPVSSPRSLGSSLHAYDQVPTQHQSPSTDGSYDGTNTGAQENGIISEDFDMFLPDFGAEPLLDAQAAAFWDMLSPNSQTFSMPMAPVAPLTSINNHLHFAPQSRSDDTSLEEILRGMDQVEEDSSSTTARSKSISALVNKPPTFQQTAPDMPLFLQPEIGPSPPDMLMLRFDKHTCSILSVKDGPAENPWRTLIWPLAGNSAALHHAIACMTAFHASYDTPNLITQGEEHESKSRQCLDVEINKMSEDAAVATLLVLGFAESWKAPTKNTSQHVRRARRLVNKAVVKDQGAMKKLSSTSQDALRLRYLCNAFVFMDVISRFTSLNEEDEDTSGDILSAVNYPSHGLLEVDPLLGSAVSLFPLISKAAGLIQQARRLDRSSLTLVSQGYEIQRQLQQWRASNSSMFERLNDQSEVLNAIQTAEAMRYATLLYLHQAIPELPSIPARELARKVLMKLATTPAISQATNLQIFPLFIASCEMNSEDDRSWIKARWEALAARLRVGNVNRSWDVVQEVWRRRHAHQAEKKAQRDGLASSEAEHAILDVSDVNLAVDDLLTTTHHHAASNGSIPSGDVALCTDELEEEYQIRGKLHWLRVLQDRQWNVFLG